MNSDAFRKIQLVIGVLLFLLTVIGFLFMIVTNLPKEEEVNSQAQVLQVIPRNFFSADNPIIQQIKKLNVPSGVPVTVDGGNLGRSSVFERY